MLSVHGVFPGLCARPLALPEVLNLPAASSNFGPGRRNYGKLSELQGKYRTFELHYSIFGHGSNGGTWIKVKRCGIRAK
jgi:hypothetical protein